jgi:hypothetical protein
VTISSLRSSGDVAVTVRKTGHTTRQRYYPPGAAIDVDLPKSINARSGFAANSFAGSGALAG